MKAQPINSAFWKQYPKDAVQFDKCVKEGIFAHEAPESLPTPPNGYFWNIDCGGIVFKEAIPYRLWHNKFGYMPKSE